MLPDNIPHIQTEWTRAGYGPDGKIVVLDIFHRQPWGVFVVYRFPSDPPYETHCSTLDLFRALFIPLTEPFKCSPPAEKSSSKISWRKRLSSFIERLRP